MEVIKALRIQEPLLFFLLLCICLFILFLVFGKKYVITPASQGIAILGCWKKFSGFINVCFALAIANYVLLVSAYVLSSTFFDHAEANVASVSWLFKNGSELYPDLSSGERYINNYGPVLYIISAFFLQLFGPSFLSVKLGCGLAAILSVVCIFWGFKAVSSFRATLLSCAYFCMALLSITTSFAFQASSFWLRPDPLLIFFVSFGLLGVLRGNRVFATVATAAALGCSVNLKINAFICFIPIYLTLFSRFGLLHTVASLSGAVGIACLPFMLFPQISFNHFIGWLSFAGKKPSSLPQLLQVSKWVVYVSMPITLSLVCIYSTSPSSFSRFIRVNRGLIYSSLFALGFSLLFSVKLGVLENNLLPFIPLFSYVLALSIDWLSKEVQFPPGKSVSQTLTALSVSAVTAFSIIFPSTILLEEARLISSLVKSPGSRVVDDIENVVKTHPNTSIGMGFSEGKGNYELTYYRPVLVFKGNPYLIDVVSMFEMQMSQVEPLSSKTLEAINTCKTQLWLFPKVTREPFDLANFYPPHQLLFSSNFRESFLKVYKKSGESNFFDLWSCDRR